MFRVAILKDAAKLRPELESLAPRFASDFRVQWEGNMSPSELHEVQAVVTNEHEITSRELERWRSRFNSLKVLSLSFTGFERFDRKACAEAGLHAYYCPGYSTASVAELTLALTLAVMRGIPRAVDSAGRGKWDALNVVPGRELHKKTVGILGLGKIGQASARRFLAMGCKVIGWNRSNSRAFKRLGIRRVSDPDQIFRRSDVVVVHLELNQNTKGIVSADRIGLMKESASMINTARAGLINNVALAQALVERRIFGAGIDVFEGDPLDDERGVAGDPLLSLNPTICNLVATPHLGYKTVEAFRRLALLSLANIQRFQRRDGLYRLVPSEEFAIVEELPQKDIPAARPSPAIKSRRGTRSRR